MMNLNKIILSFKPIQYTTFWYWFRLIICNQIFDFNHRYEDFWFSINYGWDEMKINHLSESLWKEGVEPEIIFLSQQDYDFLVEKLNQPPDPETIESLKNLMNRPTPWN